MIDGNVHDSGGLDGRKYIIEILQKSIKHLNDGGSLFLLIFDFLGTNKKTNDDESLFTLGKKIGYSKINVVDKRKKIVKENSVSYKSLDYIKKVYPKYIFNKLNDDTYYNIQIIEFKK